MTSLCEKSLSQLINYVNMYDKYYLLCYNRKEVIHKNKNTSKILQKIISELSGEFFI